MSTKYLARLNLRAFRYCVLGEQRLLQGWTSSISEMSLIAIVLICNALTASFSAWNLGIVQGIEGSRRQ